jgi:hypothetical protein
VSNTPVQDPAANVIRAVRHTLYFPTFSSNRTRGSKHGTGHGLDDWRGRPGTAVQHGPQSGIAWSEFERALGRIVGVGLDGGLSLLLLLLVGAYSFGIFGIIFTWGWRQFCFEKEAGMDETRTMMMTFFFLFELRALEQIV